MNILVITQYFFPESFRINDVCLGLKERGHKITVLTGKPNYPSGRYFDGYNWFNKSIENWNEIEIYRSNLFLRGKGGAIRLFLNYFSFAFFASIKLLFINKKFDKILIFAPSPITVGIPGVFGKKKFNSKTFLWVHDLWPESIKIAGGVKTLWILKLIDKLTRWIYSNTDELLIQSNGFLSYINSQGVNSEKIKYYPFYAESFYKVLEPEQEYLEQLPSGFKILFAGNIGESQSFMTLLSAAKILKEKNILINWIIFGDGRMKKNVEKEIKISGLQNNFILKGTVPASEMPKYFSCVNGLVISLKNSDIFSRTIPGKLQSYLACGKPIIGSLNGVGADIIKESGSGFVGSAESVDELVDAIIKLYNTPLIEQTRMGLNARKYFDQEFERERLLDKLEIILRG